MTYRAPRQATSGKIPEPGFKRVEPLADWPRVLAEPEIRQVFSSVFQKNASEMAARFEDARATLRELYGACAEIMETPSGGLRFSARLEFLTEDRSLDTDLNQAVAGRGFALKLHSVPVTEGSFEERYELRVRYEGIDRKIEFHEQRALRKYVITESEASSRIDRAVQSAEALLALARMLRPAGIAEDLPANVVPLKTARTSRPPPKPKPQEQLVEALPSSQGGKAS
jgi:hypothetical protein